MKHFSLLALLFYITFCITLFSSCNKSFDQQILGKWDYSESKQHVSTSIFIADTTISKKKGLINFKINGAGTFSNSDTSYAIKWLLAEDEITITIADTINTVYTLTVGIDKYQVWNHEKISTKTENDIESTEKWNAIAILEKR